MTARISTSISKGMGPEMASARIAAFRRRFNSEAYYHFAQHAAFPLALTPDLLYQLRAHFQHDITGKKLNIPWIAIADLLLSPICEETDSGYELYEMDVSIRAQLLKELQDSPRFGPERMKQLAYFLLDYIQEQIRDPDPTTLDLIQGQTWTSLAYVKPDQIARELAEQITVLYNNGSLDQIRITSIMETLKTLSKDLSALDGFQPLLTYAQVRSHTFLGHTLPADMQELITQTTQEVAATLNINLPTDRREKPDERPGRAERSITSDFYISHHIADHDWAQWIARQLQAANYTVNWGFEFGPASSLDIDTSSLRNQARHTIALLSPDYLRVDSVQKEWTAILAQGQRQKQRLLLPIRVRECTPQGTFASIQYVDLVGQERATAPAELLRSIQQFLDDTIDQSTPQKAMGAIKIFVSYAHKDAKLAQALERQLAPIERQGLIRLWDSSMIPGGVEWKTEILRNLNDSQIILLLVSPDFLASDFGSHVEIQRAMERQKAGEARVIPILIRPADWKVAPFASLQVLPRNGKAITTWENRELAFEEVAMELRKIIEAFKPGQPPVSKDDESRIQELEGRANKTGADYTELGNLYERLRRIDEAIRAYEQARSLQPSDVDVLFALSRLYNDTGAYERSIEILNQLITLQPDFADAYKQRGLVYRREADAEYAAKEDDEQRLIKYKLAIADLERAVELRPNFEEALGSLGGIYRRLKDYEQAVTYYQRLYDINKSSSYALGNLGSLSWYLGRREEARNYFTLLKNTSQTRLQEQAPQIQSQVVREEAYWDYYDLALSQLATGEVDAAKETYAKAIEETPAIEQFGAVLNNLYFLQRAEEPIKGLEEIIALIEKARDKK